MDMAIKYDVVWYWVGGTQHGQWNPAFPDEGIEEGVRVIERMGYVAHAGRRAIGPPEGAPPKAELDRVLGWQPSGEPAPIAEGPNAHPDEWEAAPTLAPFVDVSTVTEYGMTQRLSNAIRCF
jgi:hypothetical protein